MFFHLILLFLSVFATNGSSTSLGVQVITSKNAVVDLEPNATINIKRKPFTMKFEFPKKREFFAQLHTTFEHSIYESYLISKDLSQLDAWQPGSTMAVSIISLVGNDDILRANDDAVQGYLHQNNGFTSFATIDSTENTILISKTFSAFQDLSESHFSKEASLKLKKAKGKTLYCILKCGSEINGETEEELVIPFIIEI